MRAIVLAVFLAGFAPFSAAALPLCKEVWGPGAWRPLPGETYASYSARLPREACEKEWTVLVYMAPTADLLPHALADLNEMEAPFSRAGQAASSGKLDLLVQIAAPGESPSRLHLFERETAEGAADLGALRSPRVETLPSGGARPAAQLEAFLHWGAARYPARHYMVILWGHGEGWRAGAEAPRGGFLFGEAKEAVLGIPDLSAALRTFREANGRPIDVYASDSCYMQMVEVAYELKDEARFVVGSTHTQNFLGFPYRRLFYELNTGHFNGARNGLRGGASEGDEAFLLARMLPELTKQSLDPARGSQGKTQPTAQSFLTASSLASSELTFQLSPALRELGAALKTYLEEDRLRGIDIQLALQEAAPNEAGAQDAGLFLGQLDRLLKEEAAKGPLSAGALTLSHAVARASSALGRAVVAEAFGDGYILGEGRRRTSYIPRGISLWLPSTGRDFLSRREDFLRSRFYREAAWNGWLDLLYRP